VSVSGLRLDIAESLSTKDAELVEKAYEFARKAHEGQHRLSGEEFIEHPLAVAKILAEMEGDAVTLAAALLHDTVEDTDVSLQDIEKEFGPEVAKLVDGVTKLARIEFKSPVEEQVSNLRKMFLAMAEDWRVVVIRLADRLHNLRTLYALSPEKQKATAEETLEIYAPLAHRLGIWRFKWELEDLAFKYLHPEEYRSLAHSIAKHRSHREAEAAMVMAALKERLIRAGIPAEVQSRAKNLYSIYRKMQRQGKALSEIYDLIAARVIVNTVTDCYEVLGICHTLWKPVPGRFKDYIAMPKPNGYQSLHTTVVGPLGEPFEIQIRTREMDRTAEYGSAAHWRYKEGTRGDESFEEKMAWLRQLLDWQREMTDAREFMEALKLDIFNDEVFVFTPKGDVIDLPVGSTPLDFAYRIHTDIGNHCVGAKANGKMVPLDYKLQNGDIVEIIVNRQSGRPSMDWLDIVKTPSARSKIRQFFKKELRDEDILRGRTQLEKEILKAGLKPDCLDDEEIRERVLERLRFTDFEDVYAAIAYGGLSPVHVASRIKEEVQKKTPPAPEQALPPRIEAPAKPRGPEDAVIVKGMRDLLVRLAHCCNPVPGDPIIGYITRGRGVSVHRLDCPSLENFKDRERFVEVSWDENSQGAYPSSVEVRAHDRPGLFADITGILARAGANILSASAKGNSDGSAFINVTFETHDLEELKRLTKQMRDVRGVTEVRRVARPSRAS